MKYEKYVKIIEKKWIFANKSCFRKYVENLRIFDEIMKISIKCNKKDEWSNF